MKSSRRLYFILSFSIYDTDRVLIMHRLLLHRTSTLQTEKIKIAFKRYGCNMRTLNEVIVTHGQLVEQKLYEKIDTIGLSAIQKMLKTNSEVSSGTTHSIIKTECLRQPQPGEERYGRGDLPTRTISSPVVLELLYRRYGRSLYAEKDLIPRLFERVQETSSAARWMWEGRCHYCIYSGGSFRLVPMKVEGKSLVPDQSNHPQRIAINPLVPKMANEMDSIDRGEYYIPHAKKNPTFDACFLLKSRQMALQMTVASTLSLDTRGFDMLERALPDNHDRSYVFVVPINKARTFKCTAPAPKVQKKFQFHLLALNYRKCCPSQQTYQN